jgi:hypothetical protein
VSSGRPGGWSRARAAIAAGVTAAGVGLALQGLPRPATTAAGTPSPPASLRAFHRDGQTFLIWKEQERLLNAAGPRIGDYRAALARARSRYRVYRSQAPIDAAGLGKAEMVAEVDPLSAFNPTVHGASWDRGDDARPLLPYVVTEGDPPLAADDGLYVATAASPGTRWYAVMPTIDGRARPESLQVSGPIEESPAISVPVLQSRETGTVLFGEGQIHHYVRWTAPPETNQPSLATNWVVGIPASSRWPAPLQVGLHEWGGTAWYGYGWWYGWQDGTVLLATNDVPQTWWYGYHDAYGRRPPRAGDVVHNYTERRVLGMLEWVRTRWKIDPDRVFVAGASMGGSGASAMAVRHADVFAFAISWVGLHDLGRSPQFTEGLADLLGAPALGLRTADGAPVWDRVNLPRLLREDPAAETAFLTFANGRNDGAIGWPQAVDFARALQETRRPFVFRWGTGGHGERAFVPTAEGGSDHPSPILDIRRNRSLPAFTRGSLDDDPGDGGAGHGAPEGQMNLYLRWDPGSVVDRADRWEARLYLVPGSPRDTCTADVTARRVQAFKPAAGTRVAWRNVDRGGAVLQAGTVVADRWGLVTVPAVRITRAGGRLALSPAGS